MKSTISLFKFNSGRFGKLEVLQGISSVINVPVYESDDSKAPMARALLIEDSGPGPLILLDIVVYDPENRRKGVAEDLLKMITDVFPHIETGYFGKPGLELCLKCGFVLHKAMFKNEGDKLVFKSEIPKVQETPEGK